MFTENSSCIPKSSMHNWIFSHRYPNATFPQYILNNVLLRLRLKYSRTCWFWQLRYRRNDDSKYFGKIHIEKNVITHCSLKIGYLAFAPLILSGIIEVFKRSASMIVLVLANWNFEFEFEYILKYSLQSIPPTSIWWVSWQCLHTVFSVYFCRILQDIVHVSILIYSKFLKDAA